MKKLVFFIVLLFPFVMRAQTYLTDADLAKNITSRTYSRIACHDPSIFVDNITNPSDPIYYIYGSHLGAAYTTSALNYQTWTFFGGGETDGCTLFCNTSGQTIGYSDAYSTHAKTTIKNYAGNTVPFGNYDAHQWQYSGNTVIGNQWAPDVIYNPTMGKWLMYMSVNGDNWCSVIVCLTADSPTGPWTYQGPVVFSGFQGTYTHNGYAAANDYQHTDLQIALGSLSSLPTRYNVGSSWGSYWPNAIDPCVFYDQSGNLWMSYGSWSGGMFILQLDETTGLRDYTVSYPYQVNGTTTSSTGSASQNCTSDPYFGTKIAGGYYVSGEASYIHHIGNYYYLFVTYGGLTATGGYQMRVFRSSNPDGPYKDCLTSSGISAIYSNYRLNYGSDATRDEGVKLMAGYQWEMMPTAEVAQGHNSVITDNEGRNLLVYHTRFNDGTEGHQVRVHQLFQNADGWLVASPYEFDGETVVDSDIASTQLYTADEVAGEYQFMAHPYRQNTADMAVETPVNITLNANGSITGDYTGTWSLTSGTSYITLTLSGAATNNASVTFKGVLTRQTIDYTGVSALCFTALSSSSGSATSGGASLQTRGLSVWGSKADASSLFSYILSLIDIPYHLTSDVALPSGVLGATVTWASSDESVVSSSGQVVGSGTATLTATMTKDNYIYTADYAVKTVEEDEVLYPECGAMDYSNAFWTTFSDNYRIKAGQSRTFRFYNHTKGEYNWQNWMLYGCSAFSGGAMTNEYFGIRADNWDNTTASNTGCTSNYNWETFLADMDGAYVDMTCSYTVAGVFTMNATITTTGGTVYTYQYTKTVSGSPSQFVLLFMTEASYIGPDPNDGAVYYPECGAMDYSNAFWTTFSDNYRLQQDCSCSFRFYNHTKGEYNWQNWMLYGCSAFSGGAITDEYFGLRADNWDNTSASNTGCSCDYDWGTFLTDMDDAYVDMTCSYTAAGVFTMNATITTTGGKVYTYQVTKTIASAPSQIVLFFLTEASYIGGGNSDVNEDGAVDLSDVTMATNSLLGTNKARLNTSVGSEADIAHIVGRILGR